MENDLRIYGVKYHLWRDGVYLGTATWVDSPDIGDAFVRKVNGINDVYIADKWKIVN